MYTTTASAVNRRQPNDVRHFMECGTKHCANLSDAYRLIDATRAKAPSRAHWKQAGAIDRHTLAAEPRLQRAVLVAGKPSPSWLTPATKGPGHGIATRIKRPQTAVASPAQKTLVCRLSRSHALTR